MELDDLKHKWQNNHLTNTSTSKNKIMELSQQKSYGPAASLKTALGRQVVIIPFLFIILIVKAIQNPSLQSDPFFGLFAGLIVLGSVFFAVAYFILTKTGRTDVPVADQLKCDIRLLEYMLWSYRLTYLAGVILLAVFLEVFKNAGTAQLIQPWYDIATGLRICAYTALIAVSFFVSRFHFNKEFGKHVEDVKKNLSDMA